MGTKPGAETEAQPTGHHKLLRAPGGLQEFVGVWLLSSSVLQKQHGCAHQALYPAPLGSLFSRVGVRGKMGKMVCQRDSAATFFTIFSGHKEFLRSIDL